MSIPRASHVDIGGYKTWFSVPSGHTMVLMGDNGILMMRLNTEQSNWIPSFL